jgi:hypothetical protein
VGVGVANRLKGCYKFQNNSKAINGENFKNIKQQCIIKLSEYVADGKVCFPDEHKEQIIKEFGDIKYTSKETDRVEIESKEKMKQQNGYSPDLFDAVMLRMVFSLKKPNTIRVF